MIKEPYLPADASSFRVRCSYLKEALLDIAGTDNGHQCQCQCANNLIEFAQEALLQDDYMRKGKKGRCWDWCKGEMDRVFGTSPVWAWKTKKHLTPEWKALGKQIKIYMGYAASYSVTDVLWRWHRYWVKQKSKGR